MASVVTKEMQGRGHSTTVKRSPETHRVAGRAGKEESRGGRPGGGKAHRCPRETPHPEGQAGQRRRDEGADGTLASPPARLSCGKASLAWCRRREHEPQGLGWAEHCCGGGGRIWEWPGAAEACGPTPWSARMGSLPVTKRGRRSLVERASPASLQASHPRSEKGPDWEAGTPRLKSRSGWPSPEG